MLFISLLKIGPFKYENSKVMRSIQCVYNKVLHVQPHIIHRHILHEMQKILHFDPPNLNSIPPEMQVLNKLSKLTYSVSRVLGSLSFKKVIKDLETLWAHPSLQKVFRYAASRNSFDYNNLNLCVHESACL
jgi:hypothetical protein